jgi:hypothetical protein
MGSSAPSVLYDIGLWVATNGVLPCADPSPCTQAATTAMLLLAISMVMCPSEHGCAVQQVTCQLPAVPLQCHEN